MNDAEANYREWIAKAEENEFAGGQILSAGRFPAPAAFHFQQMAEKLLKALLIFHEQEFSKVHDLIALAGAVKDVAPDIDSIREELELRDRYYVESRYPGDFPEITAAECKDAQRAAQRVKEFVSRIIGDSSA